MPIVTPNWNLPTPALTDAYNLVGDLATFASAVDGALTTAGTARRGTAAQRITFSTTSVNGMLWQDTDSIKMVWRRDSTVSGNWTPAVTRWTGTTAQMNSFAASAPNGFEWFNTSDNSEYVRLGGAWVGVNVGVRLSKASNQAIAGGGTGAAVTWSSVVSGSSSMFSLANPTRITVPSSGVYLFTSNIVLETVGLGIIAKYRVNGVSNNDLGETTGVPAQGTWSAAVNLSQLLTLTAGSYVEVIAAMPSSGSVRGPSWTFLQCTRVSP